MLNAHLSFFTGEALGKVFTERGGLPVWSSKLDLLRWTGLQCLIFAASLFHPCFLFITTMWQILVRGKKYSRQWGSYKPCKNEWKLVYSMCYIEMLMMWSVKKSIICSKISFHAKVLLSFAKVLLSEIVMFDKCLLWYE